MLGCGASFFGVNSCSAANCNVGVLAGEVEYVSFYSAILEYTPWGITINIGKIKYGEYVDQEQLQYISGQKVKEQATLGKHLTIFVKLIAYFPYKKKIRLLGLECGI